MSDTKRKEKNIIDNFKNEIENISETKLLQMYTRHSCHSNDLTHTRAINQNSFMITNVILIATCIFFNSQLIFSLIATLLGLGLTYGFLRQLSSLKVLNSAKCDLLIAIEEKMGLNFLKSEWDLCNLRNYKSITSGSNVIAWSFGIVYIIILLKDLYSFI